MTHAQRRARRRGAWVPRLMIALLVGIAAALVIYERSRAIVPERAPAIAARLELAAGEVFVDEGDGERRAAGETPLRAGARVRTAAGARALVRLPDGSSAFLRDDSAIALSDEAVTLLTGEYFLDAPALERKRLVHRAADAVVSGVDAGLSLSLRGETVELYVVRGIATLQAERGRVEVQAGERVRLSPGGEPRVEAVALWEDWTGGMADDGAVVETAAAGSGEIYGVDETAPGGSPAERLQIQRQVVEAVVRSGVAETEVDQTFFNPAGHPVEGWYWFTVPDGATVTSFAVETDGVLVEGELIARRDAAQKYRQAKQEGHAPAILEWIDSRTYRARIFPIKPTSTRRVVLRYVELLSESDNRLVYVYPMAARTPLRIGELSLRVDLGEEGRGMHLATLAEARIEDGGRLVTMRRSGFTPRVDFQLEATRAPREGAVRVSRFVAQDESADYLMARYTPAVEWSEAERAAVDVVVAVDTSAHGGEMERQLAARFAESLLRALGADDRFALLSVDVDARALHPKRGLLPADAAAVGAALEALAAAAPGGASDLGSLFEAALGRLHRSDNPVIVYVGDGLVTSGPALDGRLRRALGSSPARFFTVAVGPQSDAGLLLALAREGAGQSVRVDDPAEVTARALELMAAFKQPLFSDFTLDLGAGLDEPFVSAQGKVARGQEVVLLARTHHALPKSARVRGRIGGERIEREVPLERDDSVARALVPKLWASAYVRHLLGIAAGADRGRIVGLGRDYGLMTPYTSFLALESEEAYARMGIERSRSPLRGVHLTALDADAERHLASALGGPLSGGLGCARPSTSPPAEERAEERKEGGTGTRARGEDGSMGNPNAPPSRQRFGTSAEDRAAKLRDASEFGMIGLLTPEVVAEQLLGAPLARAAPMDPWTALRAALTPAVCSSEARRPLAQRARVWRRRIDTAGDAADLLARYVAAVQACELMDWRAERVFLELLQQRIDSEGLARALLPAFRERPEAQRYLARRILRRASDARLTAVAEEVLRGTSIDWSAIDRRLSAIADVDERIRALREAMARAPEDPEGHARLLELLAQAGRAAEALALGERLRRDGRMTVRLTRRLGDLLVAAGDESQALRVYSEIVEFDPERLESRRLLGDIFLARGWYEPAYVQYGALVAAHPDDPLGWLQLSAAAAGAGRIDEALRLERRVSQAQGRPGPSDPRRWARVSSAARLAELLSQRSGPRRAVERKLEELGLVAQGGRLVVLRWEDRSADVVLRSLIAGRPELVGEVVDAAAIGMSALLLPTETEGLALEASLRSEPRQEALSLQLHDITRAGDRLSVARRELRLQARATRLTL